MRKLEEEQFKGLDGKIDRMTWVRYHKFPEDTLADFYKTKGVKHRKVYHDGHERCIVCNHSSQGLHDPMMVHLSGRQKMRKFFKTEQGSLCEYCYQPEKQHFELEKKKEIYIDGKEVHALANLIKKEDMELLQ